MTYDELVRLSTMPEPLRIAGVIATSELFFSAVLHNQSSNILE